jgi:hypothetical protein
MPLNYNNLIRLLGIESTVDSTCFQRVQLAQKLVREAIDMLEEVANETEDDQAKAYIVNKLKAVTSPDYALSGFDDMQQWMDRLAEDPPEENGSLKK